MLAYSINMEHMKNANDAINRHFRPHKVSKPEI